MKYLNKFFDYIKEGIEIPDDEIHEFLIPIKEDLGIEYKLIDKRIITSGEWDGRSSRGIQFNIRNFKKLTIGGYTDQIFDNRFWEFMDEILTLRNRLESDLVSINPSISGYVTIHYLLNEKESGPAYYLRRLYDQMSAKISGSKSQFSNSVSRKLYPEELKMVVSCGDSVSPYTDRKWNGLFGSILSEFDVKKEFDENHYLGNQKYYITITPKI